LFLRRVHDPTGLHVTQEICAGCDVIPSPNNADDENLRWADIALSTAGLAAIATEPLSHHGAASAAALSVHCTFKAHHDIG
jgi:hypothetical protein